MNYWKIALLAGALALPLHSQENLPDAREAVAKAKSAAAMTGEIREAIKGRIETEIAASLANAEGKAMARAMAACSSVSWT